MTYETVLTRAAHDQACDLLLQHVRRKRRQEDLCFALWRPATGAERRTALISGLVPPRDGERHLHGNASFEAAYLARAIRTAHDGAMGLAFLHSHLEPGWQAMSDTDVVAERDRIAPAARACGLPLVGLTLGVDGCWSARFWIRTERASFARRWCDKVRVVGRGLKLTYNDERAPAQGRRPELRRTIDTWGEAVQRDIGRLRVGVVGLGSVGCLVAETLARMGVGRLVLVDADRVERHNLDRLLYAGTEDVGMRKTALAARNLKRSATAENFRVDALTNRIEDRPAYLAALDCDVLFAAVDRPLPKDVLNHIAYAHCIPVIFGGVFVDRKSNGRLGQAAWSAMVAGADARCLRCDGQYTTSDVVMERDGSLDDPSYVRGERGSGEGQRNQNVFPFSANVASYMVLEMVRLIAREAWWPEAGGKLHYSFIPNRLSTEVHDCRPHCSIRELLAAGDRAVHPFIVDVPAAEPVDRRAASSWRRAAKRFGKRLRLWRRERAS